MLSPDCFALLRQHRLVCSAVQHTDHDTDNGKEAPWNAREKQKASQHANDRRAHGTHLRIHKSNANYCSSSLVARKGSVITLEREVSSRSKGKCHHTQSDAVSLLERLDGNDRGSDGVPATGGVRALRLEMCNVKGKQNVITDNSVNVKNNRIITNTS